SRPSAAAPPSGSPCGPCRSSRSSACCRAFRVLLRWVGGRRPATFSTNRSAVRRGGSITAPFEHQPHGGRARMVEIQAQRLQDLVRDIFVAAGCSHAEATRIGQYLVGANLVGHDSHGVARVLRYVHNKRDGATVADQKVKVVTETPVIAVVDGQYGFGQTVA